jgi:hypothetical protein
MVIPTQREKPVQRAAIAQHWAGQCLPADGHDTHAEAEQTHAAEDRDGRRHGEANVTQRDVMRAQQHARDGRKLQPTNYQPPMEVGSWALGMVGSWILEVRN